MLVINLIAGLTVTSLWIFQATRKFNKAEDALADSRLSGSGYMYSKLRRSFSSSLTNAFLSVGQRIRAWLYLFLGPQQIQRGYEKAHGDAYEVPTPDVRQVFISSAKHIREMDTAGNDVLSLHAASKHMFQPGYTMHGFNWHDQRGIEGIGFVRALRTLLTQHLPSIMPSLGAVIDEELTSNLAAVETTNGAKHLPAYPIIKKLVTKANGLAFFGSELVRNEDFMTSALEYIDHVLITAEVVRLVPKPLAPAIGRFFSWHWKTQETIFDVLITIVEQRLEMQAMEKDGPSQKEKPNDCVQWIIDTSPKKDPWSAERIVYEIMAIWFGSVHALSMTITYALYDLCLHPEYIPPLRNELASPASAKFYATGQGLDLLDSFIKESARLTPVEAMTSRRTALKPFTFSSGGPTLQKGDWAAIPVQAILHDDRFYPSADSFHGFRFVRPEMFSKIEREECGGGWEKKEILQPEGPSRFTDVGENWHVWGTGKMTCAGRFYVAVTMKLILSHIYEHFDVKLVDEQVARTRVWRSTIMPRGEVVVSFTPKGKH